MPKIIDEIDTLPPIILIGNPNVGKSALFGALSGRYVEVSNYPGTTVDFSSGWIDQGGVRRRIFDSPGADTLSPITEDEMVTRDLLLSYPDSPVICVIDAKNLKRGLTLLTQLAEFEREAVVALNMYDELESQGISIDIEILQNMLGVPVTPTIAIKSSGIENLLDSLSHAAIPKLRIEFAQLIENSTQAIQQILDGTRINSRGVVLGILSGVNGISSTMKDSISIAQLASIEHIKESLQTAIPEPVAFVIAKSRNNFIQKIYTKAVLSKKNTGRDIWKKIGEISIHPYLGIPILLAVVIGLYLFVGVLGAQVLVGVLENSLFARYINPFFVRTFSEIPSNFIFDLFVGQYGIITMALTYAFALILPIVSTFFIAFGALEDSGYLPRLAFMVDRVFKKIGLNGRAVLPMILGLGCDTMAILTTRILSTKKEKIMVTFLLALAVPCSAQLGVTLGILGAISPLALGIWITVVLGILFLVGYLSSKVIPGRSSDFILEIPPLRLPRLDNIIMKTLMRLEWYLKEAVPLFVLGTLILFILDKLSLLGRIEKLFQPIASGWLGLPPHSADAFIMGFLRRDYGAAGFKTMFDGGQLDPVGAIVALTVITLFVPCVANFFIMIKERGMKTTLGMVAFIFPFAILVGGILNIILRGLALWS